MTTAQQDIASSIRASADGLQFRRGCVLAAGTMAAAAIGGIGALALQTGDTRLGLAVLVGCIIGGVAVNARGAWRELRRVEREALQVLADRGLITQREAWDVNTSLANILERLREEAGETAATAFLHPDDHRATAARWDAVKRGKIDHA